MHSARARALVCWRAFFVLGIMSLVVGLLAVPSAAQAEESCPEDAPEADFTDRDEIPAVHRENVDCAAHFDIVQGFPDGTYRPELPVRRDQMASFIANTLDAAGADLPEGESDTFSDVPDSNVHSDNVNRLAAAGIVEGGPGELPPSQYGPGRRTRRDQMASFLIRAAGFALHGDVDHFGSGEQQFSDVPPGNVHFETVNAAALNGLSLGVGGGQYAPARDTRRDQMASFVVRLLSFVLEEDQPPGPITEGPITLNQDRAPQGGVITGMVEDAGSIQSMSVTGCGFQNEEVDLAGDGSFSLNVPSGQAIGDCTLSFSILYTDDTSETVDIPFRVTEEQIQRTNGPSLLRAERDADEDLVIYHFGTDITGAAPQTNLFRVYDTSGIHDEPTAVQIRPDNESVIAEFDAGVVSDAVRATVRHGAVEDPQGREAYAAGVPLVSVEEIAGRTDAPDLESVGNLRLVGGQIVADYRFDEPVLEDDPGPGADPAATPNPSRFFLINSDGVEKAGESIMSVSADGRTVSVRHGPGGDFPISQVRRGAASSNAVYSDSDDEGNPLQAEPVDGEGRTRTPDLVEARVVGPNQVSYRFDAAVASHTVDPAMFRVYSAAGNSPAALAATPTLDPVGDPATPGAAPPGDSETPANDCSRALSPTTDVLCTFPGSAVANAVGANVAPAAVTQVGAGAAGAINVRDEQSLQGLQFVAGRTALPDLVSVTVGIDNIDNTEARFQFDQVVLADFDLWLVDAENQRFEADADGMGACQRELEDSNRTIVLTNCFSQAEINAAVVGSTQDEPGIPEHTEGHATARRS